MIEKIKMLLSQTEIKNWQGLNNAHGKFSGWAQANLVRGIKKLNKILAPAGLMLDIVKMPEEIK